LMLLTVGIVLGLLLGIGNVAFCWWIQTRNQNGKANHMRFVDNEESRGADRCNV
jgi:uncharacterized protein involved in exopolysaccharide biosynthesis